jgi:hypothetical protein
VYASVLTAAAGVCALEGSTTTRRLFKTAMLCSPWMKTMLKLLLGARNV